MGKVIRNFAGMVQKLAKSVRSSSPSPPLLPSLSLSLSSRTSRYIPPGVQSSHQQLSGIHGSGEGLGTRLQFFISLERSVTLTRNTGVMTLGLFPISGMAHT